MLEKLFTGITLFFGLNEEDAICQDFAQALRKATLDGSLQAIWTHIPNEFDGTKSPIFGKKLKAIGKINGAPDYVFIGKAIGLFIEIKSAKGKQSASQKLYEEWCKRIGAHYHICRSAEEALNVLKHHGLLKTEQNPTLRIDRSVIYRSARHRAASL